MSTNKYSIVIPTFNAGDRWIHCLQGIQNQTLSPVEILVVDSSSKDKTVSIAKEFGCNVVTVLPEDFGHGKTRQFAVSNLTGADYVVFITQDAILNDGHSIENLLRTFSDNSVGAVFGRQCPNAEAGILEIHERAYSYAPESNVREFEDRIKLGMKICFLSNAYTAYRVNALDEVGGFPSTTIVSEDMYVGAKMLKAGWKLAYCANATIEHSHTYSLIELFGRYFDIGVFNAREPWIKKEFGPAESQGAKFIKSEMRYLIEKNVWLVPYSIFRNLVKYAGFKLGEWEHLFPSAIKKRISRQKQFWTATR